MPVLANFIAATRRRLFASQRFTRTHEWVQEGDHRAITLGITDYAQQALGDIVYVSTMAKGVRFAKDGSLESAKGASDVYAPVDGTIEAVNENVLKRPSLINKSPEQEGWLLVIRAEKAPEWSQLMDKEQYAAFLEK